MRLPSGGCNVFCQFGYLLYFCAIQCPQSLLTMLKSAGRFIYYVMQKVASLPADFPQNKFSRFFCGNICVSIKL